MKKLLLLLLLISSLNYGQQAYYNDVNLSLTGTALRDALATKIISTHTNYLSYDEAYTVIKKTDEDSNNNNNVILLYNSVSESKNLTVGGGNTGTQIWNREHTYAKSLGNPNLGTSGPGSDVHHLRACDQYVNSDRGSLKFASGNGSYGLSNSGWYPGDEWKGDVARMMMYMYLRYGNQCYPTGVAIGTTNSIDSNMVELLLDWNAADPVSTIEDQRNTILETEQGNRNPFIDNPNLATQIWGGTPAEDRWNVVPDTEVPSTPTNLTASNITNTTVSLTWTASTDNIAVNLYEIFVDGVLYTTSTTNSITLTGLTINTSYSITVYAKDAAGNTSNVSNTENITTTNVIDNTTPSIPTNLIVSNETSSTIDLSWTASTDNVEVKEYDVYVNGSFNASTLATAYTVEGLSPSTTYNFSVLARDTSNNVSTLSTAVNGTTTAAPTGASELFISEYVEGSSNNKAIEIANFTGNSITDLSIYSIKKQVNGAGTWVNKLNLSGTLANGSVYVIANSNAASTITDLADQTIGGAPIDFNGNDPVGLFKNDVLIDIVGTFNGGSSNFADNITLRRNSLINSPNITYTLSEWDSYTVDNIDDLGSHNILLSVQKYLENLFSVYPNPTSTKNITISVKNNTEVKSIQLFNLAGQLILNFENPQILQNKIELKNIPSGFYILKVFNDTAYSTKRLIVE
jgi:endonuclease I/chitodextrinase